MNRREQQSEIAANRAALPSSKKAAPTIPEEQSTYRIEVVEDFLELGIPLDRPKKSSSKLIKLLERAGMPLVGGPTLRFYIPEYHAMPKRELLKRVVGKKVQLLFDGVTHAGEAIGVGLSFWDINIY